MVRSSVGYEVNPSSKDAVREFSNCNLITHKSRITEVLPGYLLFNFGNSLINREANYMEKELFTTEKRGQKINFLEL